MEIDSIIGHYTIENVIWYHVIMNNGEKRCINVKDIGKQSTLLEIYWKETDAAFMDKSTQTDFNYAFYTNIADRKDSNKNVHYQVSNVEEEINFGRNSNIKIVNLDTNNAILKMESGQDVTCPLSYCYKHCPKELARYLLSKL